MKTHKYHVGYSAKRDHLLVNEKPACRSIAHIVSRNPLTAQAMGRGDVTCVKCSIYMLRHTLDIIAEGVK